MVPHGVSTPRFTTTLHFAVACPPLMYPLFFDVFTSVNGWMFLTTVHEYPSIFLAVVPLYSYDMDTFVSLSLIPAKANH